MARLIFVHGAYAKAESWFDIPAQFGSEPDVYARTLPGHGKPRDFLAATETLADYVSQINGFMADGEPVWLIGHSMGGMVISQVAATTDTPTQILGLIYIAAILPQDGKSTLEMIGAFGDDAPFPNHDPEDIDHALSNQPLLALGGKFDHSAQFDAIPKHYFICDQDRVIDPGQQKIMARDGGVASPIHLDSDHLPMHQSDLQPNAHPALLQGLKDIINA